jgi:hypothetical protein
MIKINIRLTRETADNPDGRIYVLPSPAGCYGYPFGFATFAIHDSES